MQKTFSPLLQISLCTFGYLYATTDISLAQVTPDGTVNTQVNQNGNVAEITGGETRGGNLFHSFQDFSVQTGNEAFFNNADSISNIFSRVTGGNISNIDGLIRANGSADLFLINPAGIIFGENARLDIGGSFYGSTASSVLFEDGEFSAVDNLQQPILTVNAPIGLGFRDNPAPINIERQPPGSADFNPAPSFDDNLFGLRVPDGKTFALAGGDITADGGGIVAVGGRIELGAVGESGTLELNFTGDDVNFSFSEDLARANVSLTNGAGFFVSGSGGGDIAITGNNINILSGSDLLAGILEGSPIPNSQAGDIFLNATEKIRIASSIDNTSNVTNQVGNIQAGNFLVGITTQGNAGKIVFNSNTFEGSGNFLIGSQTSGAGDGGQIDINAIESVSFVGDGESGVLSFVGASATGNGGDVNIKTSSLSIFDSSLLLTTIGNGNTGDLRIEANDSITVSGNSQFQSTSLGNGDSGNIVIDAPNANITFENPTTLVTTSVASVETLPGITPELVDLIDFFGIPRTSTGSSGDITVIGRTFSLSNGSKFSTSTAGQATSDGLANAGNININVSDSFVLSTNSRLESNTVGQGNAGDVNIIAGGRVTFEGRNNGNLTGITTTVNLLPNVLAEGFTQRREGGNINITANSFSLTNGSQIQSSTFGIGDAGDISIDVNNDVTLDGIDNTTSTPSSLQSNVESGAIGNSGVINIESKNLSLTNGGQIQTIVRQPNASQVGGNGLGGSIVIDVEEALIVKGFSETVNISGLDNNAISLISSSLEFGATGQSGNIDITAGSLSLIEGGLVFSGTLGVGSAGNITVDVEKDVVLAGTSQSIRNGNTTVASSGFFSNVGEFATGDGGNIKLTLGDSLKLRENSMISAEANNDGNGGNVDIDANFIIAFPDGNNDILANAQQGQGGNINITAKSLLGIEERPLNPNTNDINASSQVSGLDGTVSIFTPDINPIQGATELPTNVVEPEQTTAQACAANREAQAKNGLNITGRGGIPAEPVLPLDSQNVSINGETNPTSAIPAPIETSQGKIQPARGIKVMKSGEVILTSYRTNNSGERLPEIMPNCS